PHTKNRTPSTEQNPASYTQMIAWLAANKDARDIIASVHTGDVIQNWLRGNQEPDRAVLEFERASKIMKIFEDAGMPYGILPGNHDNVWGASNEMFNEYFPASRYESNPWWGGHGPDGNASNFFTMERDGAKFLFLQMGFDSSEEEIDWADKVIADHPDHNVIFSTHEYLRPEEDARSNPDNGRWTAQGDLLFDRLVEPHSNVVLVFSGHLHGVRQRITEREDGTHVIETVADYQSYEEDGARDALYTRLYQFDLDSGKVAANAYSPRLQSFEPWKNDPRDLGYTPESDEFVYDADLQYDKQVTTSGIAAFGAPVELGSAQLADGTAAEFTWDSLEPGAEYLWYTRAQRDASAAGGADPRYSDFRVFTAPAEAEETPETSAPETPAPETPAEQPTATVTATTTTSVSADPVTHTETARETIKETATETEKVTETEPAVTHRETVTTSTTVVTPTTVTSTAKEVSTAPNTTVTKSVPTTVVTPTTVTTSTTVEVPTTVPTTVEKRGDRVTEEQFPNEGSSVTVGSSVTITPLGILLSLLGALGAVGMIAALLNCMGINLQEYYEQFLDMLP
ncbi:metallophosphoesterase, partial [Corynebacterium sp. HMSC034A01]|uniref:metallophosphoesterase n=1 Tax=Corynebacterium sp. HMSC034A01 TaxID=1739295 RepID=UPI000A8EBC99